MNAFLQFFSKLLSKSIFDQDEQGLSPKHVLKKIKMSDYEPNSSIINLDNNIFTEK